MNDKEDFRLSVKRQLKRSYAAIGVCIVPLILLFINNSLFDKGSVGNTVLTIAVYVTLAIGVALFVISGIGFYKLSKKLKKDAGKKD